MGEKTAHVVRRARGIATVGLALLALSCGDGPLGPSADTFGDEPAPTPRPEVVAFVDVNLVPMHVEGIVPHQTVVVRGDRIEAVGATEDVDVPPDAFVIQGRDRYLMPGLTDMHVHATSQTFEHLRNDFTLFLANGVTTTRVMWGGTSALRR
jgi:hypothetical protein